MAGPAARASLLEGDVARHLFAISAPMVIGVASMLALSAVDAYFVGKLGGMNLAAISYTFPVIGLVMNLSIGLSIGATTAISRAIGSGHDDTTKRLATDAILLSFGIVTLTAIVGMLTIDPLFQAMGAARSNPETLPLIRQYMLIWYPSMILLVVPMIGNAALRAAGDSATQAQTMVIGAILNAILDPILIFGLGPIPSLGIAGAAWATVPARAVAMIWTFHVLIRREQMIVFDRVPLSVVWASWVEILRVGIPATATNIIAPLAAGLLTGLVATYGDPAVAAFGAGTRVEMLLMVIPMALTAGMSPLVGQNWGAGRLERVAQTIRLSERMSFVWGLGAWLLLFLGAHSLATQFAKEPDVVQPLQDFLVYGVAGLSFAGVTLVAGAAFNSVNQPLKATALAVVRTALLALPLAWLGSKLGGLPGVFVGMTVANVITGALSWFVTRPLKNPPAPSV